MQLGGNPAFEENQDTVCEREDFVEFGGDEQDASAAIPSRSAPIALSALSPCGSFAANRASGAAMNVWSFCSTG